MIDSRHQPEHKTIKHLRQANYFLNMVLILRMVDFLLILSRRREIELLSDGNKLKEVEVI